MWILKPIPFHLVKLSPPSKASQVQSRGPAIIAGWRTYVSEAKPFSNWLKNQLLLSLSICISCWFGQQHSSLLSAIWPREYLESRTPSRHLTSATLGEKAAAKYKDLTQCLLKSANLRDFQTEATRKWQLVTVKDMERPRDLESPWGLKANNKPFSSACKCGSEQHLKHSDEGAWGLWPWCPLLCHRC